MPRDATRRLLEITELLIKAHKLAETANDEASIALISAALFHVGGRLKQKADEDGLHGQERGGGGGRDGPLPSS